MADLFDNIILCKKCGVRMTPISIIRSGFSMRAVQCPKCQSRIIHPADEQQKEQFVTLKSKIFRVKLRLIGNSYAVSIPKEIVDFINEQQKIIDNMVKLTIDDMKKLSLSFDND